MSEEKVVKMPESEGQKEAPAVFDVDRVIADLRMLKATREGDVQGTVSRHVDAFLRAGGVVSWDFWSLLSPETRGIFAECGDQIARDRGLVLLRAQRQLEQDSAVSGIVREATEAVVAK